MTAWLRDFRGHFYHFAAIASTQTYLLEHRDSSLPLVCLAECQRAGYGQRGAKWFSPQGQLSVSIRYPFAFPAATQQGLAQFIALQLAVLLARKGKPVTVKWPNDLFLGEHKMGGILVDTLARGEGSAAIVGVGLNLRRPPKSRVDFAYYDDFGGAPPAFSECIAVLLEALDNWRERPYLPVDNDWRRYDRHYRRRCLLQGRPSAATLCGIDQKGRLIAKDKDGLHFLSNTRILTCIS